MEDSPFKVCPFCRQQIRREAVKCRFCGEWLESSEAGPARELTADKPVEPQPPPPHKGSELGSTKAVGRALSETYPRQRSDGGTSSAFVESVVAMQSETADASENRAISAKPKKPTGWVAAAVILPLGFLSWFLLGSRLLGPFWVPGVAVLSIALCLLPIIICGLKKKFAFVAIGLIGTLLFSRVQILFEVAFTLATVGAIRIAKPKSEWARMYYGREQMAKALTRAGRKTTTKIIEIAIFAAVVIATAIVRTENDQRRATNNSRNVATLDPQQVATAESYLENLGLEKFTSTEFGFGLMMPKERSTANVDLGMTFIGQVNGHSITVVAKDLSPSDPLYNVESVSAFRAQFLVGLGRNKNISGVESPRNVKDKNGHVGTEIIYTLAYGSIRYHEQSHLFQVGHRICVVQIAAPEAQWDKHLTDSVLTTFAIE
jgi:hypothetical protein